MFMRFGTFSGEETTGLHPADNATLDAIIPVLGRLAAFAALAVLILLGGCAENLARSDMITPYAGDALAANAAIQAIDPWPAAAANRRPSTDGEKALGALKRYRAGEVGTGPASSGTSATTKQTGSSTTQ